MGANERAAELGIKAATRGRTYLARCVREGNVLLTSGHPSTMTGTLGKDLSLEQGRQAAIESIHDVLGSLWEIHGTLDDVRVLRVLGCVRADADFVDHPEVLNAASDVLRFVFGDERGYHARSALGFPSLPFGAAVEIEAVFAIVT